MMINEVNMKKFLFIVALLVQQIDVLAVTVETTVNLNDHRDGSTDHFSAKALVK